MSPSLRPWFGRSIGRSVGLCVIIKINFLKGGVPLPCSYRLRNNTSWLESIIQCHLTMELSIPMSINLNSIWFHIFNVFLIKDHLFKKCAPLIRFRQYRRRYIFKDLGRFEVEIEDSKNTGGFRYRIKNDMKNRFYHTSVPLRSKSRDRKKKSPSRSKSAKDRKRAR